MSKVSGAKSIFGGPLSTRELCKAAAQNGKYPVAVKTQTPPMKLPQRTLNSKPNNVRKQRPMPFSQQPRALARTTPPSAKTTTPSKTKTRPPAAAAGVKKSPLKRKPVKETVSVKNGVKRKVEMDVSCKEKPTKTRRVVSGGGLFNRMRREAGTNNQIRVSQSRIGTLSSSTRQHLEEDVDEFIDDQEINEDWRSELRKVTNYDPAKFKDDGRDDKSMEVSLRQCWREEQRTSRLGRLEDQKELEREAKRRKFKNR